MNYFYDKKGLLYMSFIKYKDGEQVGHYLYQINEKTGKIRKLSVPIVCAGEAFQLGETKELEDVAKEVVANSYAFFDSGNYVVYTEGYFKGIYNHKTGKKVGDVPSKVNTDEIRFVLAGDDFFVLEQMNKKKEEYELWVCDEKGGDYYKLETGIKKEKENENRAEKYTFGVFDDTIVLATKEGVFEATYGEKNFRQIMNKEDGRLYYLTSQFYMFSGAVEKNAKGEYLIGHMSNSYDEIVTCTYVVE